MPSDRTTGHVAVTRHAIAEIVRAAVLGSYGVTGFTSRPIERLFAMLGLAQPGLRIVLRPTGIEVDLDLAVAYGLPVAEVARQVDAAVRYRIRTALGRDIARLRIRVDGLDLPPGRVPAVAAAPRSGMPGSSDLADSGTDVA